MAFSIKSLIGKIKGGGEETPAKADARPPQRPAAPPSPRPPTQPPTKHPTRPPPSPAARTAAKPQELAHESGVPTLQRRRTPAPQPIAAESAASRDFLELLEHRKVNRALAEQALESLSERVAQGLASGEAVELPEFGSFSLKVFPSREGTHPKTGAPITIPETQVILFRAAEELDARLNSSDPDEPGGPNALGEA